MTKRLIDKDFYINIDVTTQAKCLLGCELFTNFDGKLTSGIIVETEAYNGIYDKACHAYGGKKTKRTQVMFKEGGVAYVYLCYGIHYLFNIVTGPENTPNAILIRAIEPICGIETMLVRRKYKSIGYNICNGPGKVCQALGINNTHNFISLNEINSSIGIINREKNFLITESIRVGVDYAQEDALLPYRFRIKDNKWAGK